MQPPPRGRGADTSPDPGVGAGVAGASDDPIADRIRVWALRPTAEETLTLCDELRRVPGVRGNHVEALARAVAQRHGKDSKVLLALGRLQLAIGKLSDAQQTLVTAGRADPTARGPYRYLGEVLLRRGDAARAERMLEKAAEAEAKGQTGDPTELSTEAWLTRARALKTLQDGAGEGAVAAEMATFVKSMEQSHRPSVRSLPPSRSSLRPPAAVHADSDDQPTMVGQISDEIRRKATPGFETQLGEETRETRGTRDRGELDGRTRFDPRTPEKEPGPPPVPAPLPAPAAPALRAPLAKKETPPPVPAVRAPHDARSKLFPADASLPRFDVSAIEDLERTRPGDAAADLSVNTGDILVGDAPSRDEPSVPAIRLTPPTDDKSPVPFRRSPTDTGALRALRADAITFGEPSRDERSNTARVRFTTGSKAPAPGALWNSARVLSALERAGVYEPAAAAASPALWMKRRELNMPRRKGAWLFALLGLLIVGGVGGAIYGTRVTKERQRGEAEVAALRAEADVRKGAPSALASAEADLGRTFELDSRSMRGARVWLEDRVLRSFLWPSEERREGGLASAIERGKTVGLAEPELAFARIALALSSDDTPSAVTLARSLDPGTAKGKLDAWRELAVGWVLERAGDARAAERYAHAITLDPELIPARLALAKLAALSGDAARVTDLMKDVAPDLAATREDLVALAALIATGTGGKGGAETTLRPAGFGWIAPALIAADPTAPADTRKRESARAFTLARDPGDLTRIGRLAFAAGDEATASRAALRALEVSPIFPAARALAARLALAVGRPDDAARALENVEGEAELPALRAWYAYERQDLATVSKELQDPTLVADRPDVAAIVRSLQFALAHRTGAPLSAKDKTELEAVRGLPQPGSSVAFDVALETGDLATAEAIGKGLVDPERRPMNALRLARLARLLGHADDAERLSKLAFDQSIATPLSLVIRAIVLGGAGKGADMLALLAKHPELAKDEQPWLRAWGTHLAGKRGDAKKQVEALMEPDRRAPWSIRRDALFALTATNDKRGKAYAKELAKERPNDPDVQNAAKTLGVAK